MPQRTCKTKITYAGHDVTVGERFEVEDRDVDLLLKTGHIEPEEGEPGYVTHDPVASSPAEYSARDMTHRKRGRPRKAA